MIKHLKRHQLAYTVAAIVAALLLVPMILFVTPLLADEAYYESWEQSRTDAREVSWVQEPALHQFKMFVSPH